MKNFVVLGVGILLSMGQFARASDEPKVVIQNFQEILRRVDYRDKESHAIITVKAKSKSLAYGLKFSIEEEPNQREVVVSLASHSRIGSIVHEQYLLPLDDAVKRELGYQKQMAENQARHQQEIEQEQNRLREAQAQKINRLTNGVLKFGMSREAVEKIKGQPLSVEVSPRNGLIQDGRVRHNFFTMTYLDMQLQFDERLCDLKLTEEPSAASFPSSDP